MGAICPNLNIGFSQSVNFALFASLPSVLNRLINFRLAIGAYWSRACSLQGTHR